MANRKISDLTALTAPAIGDLLPIVDISEAAAADKNKKITYGELLASAPAGSAAAPSFSFDSDPNTGIYSPGADQVAISTNGTGRLFIDANGGVGIGNNDPSNTGLVNGLVIGNGTDNKGITLIGTSTTQQNIAFADSPGTQQGLIQYDHGGDYFRFFTASTEKLRITSAGLVGIGTSSPAAALQVIGTGVFGNGVGGRMQLTTDSNLGYVDSVNNAGTAFQPLVERATEIQFHTNPSGTTPTPRAVIDASGRLLVGTSSSLRNAALVQISGTGYPAFDINSFGTSSNPEMFLRQARGTQGSPTVVVNGDSLGKLGFQGYDGANYFSGAVIESLVDGTPGANDMPGRLVFSTTADGADSPTERMRINNAGNLLINKTVTDFGTEGAAFYSGSLELTKNANTPLFINRLTDDGTLVSFHQASTLEGTISVSGTTVSYNGAHLSRWSQLPSGAERTEILRGSVLSNIDEMCEWGDENNEQLNRMKVSDVEGDKNVSGVFQAWDDDDDTYTNDFYCAMTGDFIIRIAEGVTVERGDLLMSAGDGTAKPQDDDIIRSKTIAKVTSTNVSCTYEDGSYCVPCVLMAC